MVRRLFHAFRTDPVIASLWTTAAVLTLLKLWLVAAQPLVAAANAYYDDALQIAQAESILRGDWLGAYSPTTLAKGSAYPVFIAVVHLLHLPLPCAQQLLYSTACLALALAVRPAFRRGLWIPLLYLVLLYNPMSYEGPVMARVLRQHLATPAVMLALAGFIGLWLGRQQGYYRRMLWAAIAGFGLAANWLSREEAFLALPSVLIAALAGALAHRSGWKRPPTWILLGLPWALWFGAVQVTCALNYWHYRAWITVETRTAEFNDAYGALARVRPREWQPFVPVATETRQRIYAVSPAFAQLQGYLEGEPGRNWAGSGSALTGQPPEAREIAGGWFMWALREAAAEAGHFPDARAALAFYRRLATEVNQACDEGRLDARGPHAGVTPVWDPRYRTSFLAAWRESFHFLSHFDHHHVRPGASSGDTAGLAQFATITRATLAEPEGQAPKYDALQRARFRILERIGRSYQVVHPTLLAVAAIGTLALLAGPARRRYGALLVIQGVLVLSLGLSLAAVAMIHISMFPAIITGYFHGSYPLLLAFSTLGFAGALDWALSRR